MSIAVTAEAVNPNDRPTRQQLVIDHVRRAADHATALHPRRLLPLLRGLGAEEADIVRALEVLANGPPDDPAGYAPADDPDETPLGVDRLRERWRSRVIDYSLDMLDRRDDGEWDWPRVVPDAKLLRGDGRAIEIRRLAAAYAKTIGPDLSNEDIDDIRQYAHAVNADKCEPLLDAEDVDAVVDAALGRTRRVVIPITTDEYVTIDAAVQALSADPTVYQRGGQLVHVVCDAGRDDGGPLCRPAGTPRIHILPLPLLREQLTRAACWAQDRGRGPVPKHPPQWAVAAVAARGQWADIRHLAAIVGYPVLRPDGTILRAPGYDAATGLLCIPDIDVPDIPAAPTRDDVAAAVAALLEVVEDMPFARPAHRSAWLAGLLTLPARHAFDGPAPMNLIGAAAPGTGKGLLAHVTALIATGRPMPTSAAPEDDAEARKVITAVALAGDPLVLLDDVGRLGGHALCAALTSTVWRDRILGRSELTAELPLYATWWATGNNVELEGDIVRRVLPVTLEATCAQPEDRGDWRHPDLRAWVLAHRGRLLAAALTILRGYCAAGRPDMGLTPWGSYEAWSGLVRAAVVHAGLPDPVEARADVRERDAATGLLGAVIDWWRAANPRNIAWSAAEILRRLAVEVIDGDATLTAAARALRDALAAAITTRGSSEGLVTPRQLGQLLGRLERRRAADGAHLVGTSRQGTMHYRLTSAPAP